MLCGPFAIKFARLRYWRHARCCNQWEREMWQHWRARFKGTCLCPILFADRFGLVVVMVRAEQPVSLAEIEAVCETLYPDVTCEWKPQDCGRLCGQVVALDYGVPDEASMAERRAYYRTFAAR